MSAGEPYKLVFYAASIVEPIGEHRIDLLPLEAVRETGKTSKPVHGPLPDYFEIQTSGGDVLERWSRSGDSWRCQDA